MDYKFCIDEMLVAEYMIDECKLSALSEKKEAVFDAYCIPSHNHQTFYIKVFRDSDSWMLIYAKPVLSNAFGEHTVMESFNTALEAAERHFVYCKGKIVCGVKQLPKEEYVIKTVTECLPKESMIFEMNGLAIDGVTTLIRNLQGGVIPLFFYELPHTNVSDAIQKNREFLENFYLEIERIIGNYADAYPNLNF